LGLSKKCFYLVLRDESMAPAGRTGLMVSVVFDFHPLIKQAEEQEWLKASKESVAKKLIEPLDSIMFCATRCFIPLSLRPWPWSTFSPT
jgi:hypothetical protein